MQTSIAQSVPARNAPTHDPPFGGERLRVHGDVPVLLGLQTIVGQSPAMRRVVEQIQQVSATDSTVLLLGETGTAVFTRMSSFILLCVGVAIIWSGVLGLIEPLITRGR